MKTIAIAAAVAALLATPAFAGGGSKNGLAIGAGLGISTGKGGLVGTLLGSGNSRGGSNNVLAVNLGAGVKTGKGGVLGLLTGSGSSRGGYGHGGW